MNDPAQQHVRLRTLALLASSATAGVLVEFYDFFIFGYAAASAFPKTFFPNLSPGTALVFSYLTFGAGFPARLLGAFLFGHFGDRVGRKASFLLNITVVGASTVLVGLLPGYDRIGLWAPSILVALRIVQGIGLGGEFGGAASLLAEFAATRKDRAFWISLANLGIPGGAMLGSAVLYGLADSFAAGGWRIAMLLSAVIVVPALLARYRLADSPLFEQVKGRDAVARLPSLAVLREHARPILLLALLCAFQQMDGYVSGTYAISFMKTAGIPLASTAVIVFVARIGDLLGVLASGPLADRFGRRRVLAIAVMVTTALSYPYVLAILGRETILVGALQFLVTLLGVGLLHGLAPVLTAESFPTRYRYSGTGIAYNLSAIFGGMIAPALLAALIGEDVAGQYFWIIAVYAVYAVVALWVLLFIEETRGRSLTEGEPAIRPVPP